MTTINNYAYQPKQIIDYVPAVPLDENLSFDLVEISKMRQAFVGLSVSGGNSTGVLQLLVGCGPSTSVIWSVAQQVDITDGTLPGGLTSNAIDLITSAAYLTLTYAHTSGSGTTLTSSISLKPIVAF